MKAHCAQIQMTAGKSRQVKARGVQARTVVKRSTRLVVTAATNNSPVVIVGGGWAGFGAAWAAAKAGATNVTILDASPTPGGLASTSVVNGRVVEPGIKGFWAQYTNIFQLVKDLGIPPPFTPWTSSSFYSPQGLQVTAPVFGNQPRLPAPLGTFFYTLPMFTNLPMTDRLTAFPLFQHLMTYSLDEESYDRYDRISAEDLFRSSGVSDRLVSDFLNPILQVILFAPASQLSAAAALDALYYFALAHQQDFDVRWCRGPVGEKLLKPFADRLSEKGVQVLTSQRLSGVSIDSRTGGYRLSIVGPEGVAQQLDAQAVVFAVGIGAMKKIVASSPCLSENQLFQGFTNLQTLDVVAVRLWLDKRIRPITASNVIAGFDRTWGGTFFDLSSLQDDYRKELGSVIELDFYGATSLLPLSDDQITMKCLEYLEASEPQFGLARVTDRCVSRFKGAVSAFSPGSRTWMPPVSTGLPGVYMAGDWVKQGPGSHGAKGLCQEKALATGYQAGNAVASYLGLKPRQTVLEPEPEEFHIAAAREAYRPLAKVLQALPFTGTA